ncbi:unnamed protein product [Penicillium nalgiovense]|nr:unnamed protein product [Penicillium nalgiovense]CAG8089071.1 unnamed protein product [Penicillium nalgiovense]CAG8099029.1 unnamed protein product [Penicillium nalgiovense]
MGARNCWHASSKPVISLLVGIAFGPNGASFIFPSNYSECNQGGACLPSPGSGRAAGSSWCPTACKYLKKEWKLILLGMTAMWLATGLLVWDFARTPSVLYALVTGACVTTTDPVLSAVIVKGKFADHKVPKDPQNVIIAESDTNDGLVYPLLYFCTLPHKLGGLGRHAGGAGDFMGL